jgi:hypothetical protein
MPHIPSRICPRFPVAGIGKLHRGDGDSGRPLLTGICNVLHSLRCTTVAPPKFPRRLRRPQFSIQPIERACDHGFASRDGCCPPPPSPLLAQGPPTPREVFPLGYYSTVLRTLVAPEAWLGHGSVISLFPHLRVACRVDYEKEVNSPLRRNFLPRTGHSSLQKPSIPGHLFLHLRSAHFVARLCGVRLHSRCSVLSDMTCRRLASGSRSHRVALRCIALHCLALPCLANNRGSEALRYF